MNDPNPYAPPTEESIRPPESMVTTVIKLTLFCGLAIFVCGFIGILVGTLGGYCFRLMFPVIGPYEAYGEYYMREAMGFGSLVGLAAGVLVAIIVTGLVSVREFRTRRKGN